MNQTNNTFTGRRFFTVIIINKDESRNSHSSLSIKEATEICNSEKVTLESYGSRWIVQYEGEFLSKERLMEEYFTWNPPVEGHWSLEDWQV